MAKFKKPFLKISTITSWLFLVLIGSILFLPVGHGAEGVRYELGKDVLILSDKAYRRAEGDYFEAIGNVFINHNQRSIDGEKASVSKETGEAKVQGNVRYVGEEMTLYGSELNYNFKTQFLTVTAARIVSENFVVLGKLP